MTTTNATLGKVGHPADDIVYLRLSAADKAEAKRFAAAESRSAASFIRAMYHRGVADYKTKQAALHTTTAI